MEAAREEWSAEEEPLLGADVGDNSLISAE